ncbi:MAG: hypothetical protein D6732_28520 [Methanobacteriota archaeon]|nr:MAG: hypothetical protein D6732_28520 [Euryarchaeota archaeon]
MLPPLLLTQSSEHTAFRWLGTLFHLSLVTRFKPRERITGDDTPFNPQNTNDLMFTKTIPIEPP